jgi:pimeloyl-ACP methyl ester carboxylesterase/class 3 adenylate cyclase
VWRQRQQSPSLGLSAADGVFAQEDRLHSANDWAAANDLLIYEELSMQPTIRYAKSGNVHVAYQVFGQGPVDLVFVPGFISHLEVWWSDPGHARWLRRLGESVRVIMFDKRGTGLSDRVDQQPGMDARMDDFRAVMDAVGVERAAIMGISEAGSLASLFAATHPERCQALVLYGAFARFSWWFPTEEALQHFYHYADTAWGTGASLPMFAPSMAGNKAFQEWWGRFERLGANPAACIEIMRMNAQIDVSAILPTIHVPTLIIHRKDDVAVNVEAGRELAAGIPDARYIEIPGIDHFLSVGTNSDEILEMIVEFVTGSKAVPLADRVLATVLFTDIVESTEKAGAVGDQRWRDLLEAHDKAVRGELGRFRGREVKSLGDGFLATFDGPARAIHCAQSINAELHRLGIPIRVGIHTGEVELVDGDVRGIAVHIASRIAGLGRADDIVVSRTIKDLVAGSGISFEDFGTHVLKGLPDAWQLYRVAD